MEHGFPPAGGPTGRKTEVEDVTFIELRPGYFRMGSPSHVIDEGDLLGRFCRIFGLPWGNQPRSGGVESPEHLVTMRHPYWMAETELTNRQFERFDPHHERTPESTRDLGPVTNVSWEEARRYCAWLSARAGRPARLPSESEWENACRAGSTGQFCFDDEDGALSDYAWFDWISDGRCHFVRSKRPNAWGFFDMHGNAWEFCEDTAHRSYDGSPDDGSAWIEGGGACEPGPVGRMVRGGSSTNGYAKCRSAYRSDTPPDRRSTFTGFRPVLSSTR
jgi:formylglycine-generating enzyme required for sulfatase activity